MHGSSMGSARECERGFSMQYWLKQEKQVRKMGGKGSHLGGNSSFIVLFCFLSRAVLVNADPVFKQLTHRYVAL